MFYTFSFSNYQLICKKKKSQKKTGGHTEGDRPSKTDSNISVSWIASCSIPKLSNEKLKPTFRHFYGEQVIID